MTWPKGIYAAWRRASMLFAVKYYAAIVLSYGACWQQGVSTGRGLSWERKSRVAQGPGSDPRRIVQ